MLACAKIHYFYENEDENEDYDNDENKNNSLFGNQGVSGSGFNTGNNNEEPYILEMFNKRGWICVYCNNFNYETRQKCNRCSITKTPKKIKRAVLDGTISFINPSNWTGTSSGRGINDREGDWICNNCSSSNCRNHRFLKEIS